MAAVITTDIVKQFEGVAAVNGISFSVPDGEFMVLLGPSGCGKTTFLRIICGLEKQTGGDIVIGGNVVNNLPPRSRGAATMVQSYGLYPHYTVRKNIGFPLRTKRVASAEIKKKVDWSALLLDEPLSNLDAKLRASARNVIKQFQQRVGTTTIYVTHDQVEAMRMGDRVAVIDHGQVRQVGTLTAIYDDPASPAAR
jgi:multiple sugar transport system ATP-binding protein